MRTNLLVMCKLMFLLLIINGFWSKIADPHIPFIPALDTFNAYPGFFEWSLKSLFLISGIGLLFNVKVRTMTLLLGTTVLIIILSSKPLFRNHLFICACAFILCGLSSKEKDPWLLYLQLSLVYFGAVINKVGQIDWWNGEFMHNWLLNARENAFYTYVHTLFPERLVAKLLSWSSMGIEFSIGILLFFKRSRNLAVWAIVIFHTTLFTITGFRFGHFFEDILIYLLAFLAWPSQEIEINVRSKNAPLMKKFLTYFDWNKQFKFRHELSNTSTSWLHITYGNQNHNNLDALSKLILYSPATYFLVLFFDSGVKFLFGIYPEHIITAVWLWAGILFLLALKYFNVSKRELVLTKTK